MGDDGTDMGMDVLTTHSSFEAALEAVCFWAQNSYGGQAPCTVLVRSYDETIRVKKALAEQGCGFGVRVESVDQWIRSAWELFGDGRVLIDPLTRMLLIRKAVGKMQSEGISTLEKTPGTLRLAADVARCALPWALDYGRDGAQASHMRPLVAVLNCYQALLDGLHLVEDSEACQVLTSLAIAEGPLAVLDFRGFVAQEELLDALEAVRFEVDAQASREALFDGAELDMLTARLFCPDFEHPVKPEGAVRFLFPAGGHCQPRLVCQSVFSVLDSLSERGILAPQMGLSSADAWGLFQRCAPALADGGVSVFVETAIPFAQTAFGKAWLSLVSYVGSGDWMTLGLGHTGSAYAADYCLSLFSFMSVPQAQVLNKRARQWRGESIDEMMTDMSAFAWEGKRDFLLAIEEGDLDKALSIQLSWAAAQNQWPSGFRAVQMAAIEKARAVHRRVEELGMTSEDEYAVLEAASVRGDAELLASAERARLRMTDMRSLSHCEEKSLDAVFLCDLDAVHYPLKDDRDSLGAVLEELGACVPQDSIAQARRAFLEALRVARCQVVLERCLHDSDAQELRPSALWEELIDCYRSDPQNPDEIKGAFSVPHSLTCFASSLGEEGLFANEAVLCDDSQLSVEAVSADSDGVLEGESLAALALPMGKNASGFEAPLLSPSAIEAYLECPQKWFAQRRLGLSTIDADFGPRAFGAFAHAVLERTHDELRAAGFPRVTGDNLSQALELLEKQFDELLKEEETRIGDDALIPLSHGDTQKIKNLKKSLLDYIQWEAELLLDFAPYGAELSFGRDNPVEYAGVLIHGRLDRVDTDAFGRAVIIDYKGSVGSSYAWFQKGEEGGLPRKVQAAIYAQVVRRRFGFVPVAALYASYLHPGSVAGAYDEAVLGPLDIPGIKGDACGCQSFLDELDRVEESIAVVLKGLKAGIIAPNPLDQRACAYCPVVSCQRRLS